MGSYTCMRFVGEVRKEYIKDIKEIFTDDSTIDFDGEFWEEFAKRHPFAKNFSQISNSPIVPFSSFSAYNEDKFQSRDGGEPAFSRVLRSCYHDVWVFQCDSKNYGNTYEAFLKEIACVICTKFHAEIWSDFCSLPEIIVGENGEMHTIRECECDD